MIRKKLLILGAALCLATSANIVTAFAETTTSNITTM